MDDYCATAAESLLKHVLLRAKGRVALRSLSTSTASSPSPHHHVLLGEDTTPRSTSNDENQDKENGDVAAGRNRTLIDDKSNDSYDDDDDAFDDSSVEDGTDQVSPNRLSVLATSPEVAPTASPSAVTLTAPKVPPIDSLMSDAADPTTSEAPPGSSSTLNVPSDCCRQQHQQQQQQGHTFEMPATSTPAQVATSAATTQRTEVWPAPASPTTEGTSNGESGVSNEKKGRKAHRTGDGGENNGGGGARRLRRQAPPISARR